MSPVLQRERSAGRSGAPELRAIGIPAVDLLPEVVRRRRAARSLRVKCVTVLLGVVLLLVAGMALAMGERAGAQSRRTASQVESDRLTGQIAGYADVSRVQSDIAAVRGAITHGMRNEVLWADLVRHFEGSLPGYAEIDALSISIVFDSEFLSGGSGPFDPADAIGEVSWVIDVATLEQSGSLITALNAADGFIGATFTAVDRDTTTGRHRVTGSVHLDGSMRSNRFSSEVPAEEVAP
jgi:hypothetical protein